MACTAPDRIIEKTDRRSVGESLGSATGEFFRQFDSRPRGIEHEGDLQASLGHRLRVHVLCEMEVVVNLTLAVDERIVARARKRAEAMGKSLNQLVREYLERLGGGDDGERDVEELRQLSVAGKGRSRGWRFDRDELHERS